VTKNRCGSVHAYITDTVGDFWAQLGERDMWPKKITYWGASRFVILTRYY